MRCSRRSFLLGALAVGASGALPPRRPVFVDSAELVVRKGVRSRVPAGPPPPWGGGYVLAPYIPRQAEGKRNAEDDLFPAAHEARYRDARLREEWYKTTVVVGS